VTGKGHILSVVDKDGGKIVKVSMIDPNDKTVTLIGDAQYKPDIATKLKQKKVTLQGFDEKKQEEKKPTVKTLHKDNPFE
jgi:hypothetical protein